MICVREIAYSKHMFDEYERNRHELLTLRDIRRGMFCLTGEYGTSDGHSQSHIKPQDKSNKSINISQA